MDNTNSTAPRCYTCKWWTGSPLAKDLSQAMGECHRFPPQVAGLVARQGIQGQQTSAVTAFPTSNALAGCGEHTPGMVMQ